MPVSDAEDAIADLDADLAENGEDIVLRRNTLGPAGVQIPFDVTCRAMVRGYAPQELVAGISQQDSLVILSPTEATLAGWPGAATRSTNIDRRVPVKGDVAIIAGKSRAIEAAVGIYVTNVLVRMEMQVKG